MSHEPVDRDALLLAHTTGELTDAQRRALFEAAAHDQELFDLLLESDALRHALERPEERARAGAVLAAWSSGDSPAASEASPTPYAALTRTPAPHGPPSLLRDVLGSVLSTVATTLVLRLCYTLITAIGASFLGAAPSSFHGGVTQPVPSILHLVHAVIAALLLAIQFTPFLAPQSISAEGHYIARRCLGQFIAGWRWAWGAWLALYCWLWAHAALGAAPYPVADILNCLTSFPLFWCFFVLDQPSVALPSWPERNAAFRRSIGAVWGIGAGVTTLAVAGRLHLWGLNEFGLVFMGIYDGLAIAFLVGRFDSHWMKVPRWMLAPLYGYALIQMIYVFFFTLPAEWQIYTYLVALLFKVCLFFVVTHLLHAGNLRVYLEAAEDGRLGPQSA
jgi:hypothetical protein